MLPPPYEATNVDEASILEALATLDVAGNEEGLIPRFGVMLTRHFANFYNRHRLRLQLALRVAHRTRACTPP